MSQPADEDLSTDLSIRGSAEPLHGFQGDRGAAPARRGAPLGLTVAISREAGARGGTIARLVGRKLGWQVYDQELLEYMTQDGVVRQGLTDALSPASAEWVEARLAVLQRTWKGEDPAVLNLARVVLALAAQGQVVLIGRGAGCILPRATTLNVRVVAPLEERIAYMGQWLRLGRAEAAERVRLRDERRTEFVTRNFGGEPAEVHQYDLVLNSSYLGEGGAAGLIAEAARLRWAMVEGAEV
jgi:cytidylate kinase